MFSSKIENLILIGASTGGPGFIKSIISALTDEINGIIIIAQHMSKVHLESFCRSLNSINSISVEFVREATKLSNGTIYILGDTAVLTRKKNNLYLKNINDGFYHPTIDELFFSAALLQQTNISAYLLSGIGKDGARGLLTLKNANFQTIAQDKMSSIVYGMPKSAFELNAVQKVMSIDEIIYDIKLKVC